MDYRIIKILLILLCSSCGLAQPDYRQVDNTEDSKGIKRSVVAFRLFVDGKLYDDGYSSHFTKDFYKTDFFCCSNIKYGDLILDCASSYMKVGGQKVGDWASFISIELGQNKRMQVNISKELLGRNFYIDSLPFKPGHAFNILPSKKLNQKISLRNKFSMLKRWKNPKDLVSKENELNFRRYFALDTIRRGPPVYDLFNKGFYEIKFIDLKR